jgi:purine-binding chemotaxis protein CheW
MTATGNNIRNITEAAEEMNAGERQLVVFRLLGEEFGLEIEDVKEIVRMPDITPVPKCPDYVAGICNLRGNVLPVIDTRTRFSLESQAVTDHSRLLVVEKEGMQTSLMVDSVREVMRMRELQEEPPPPVCRGIDRQFLRGVVKVDQGERLIMKLNLEEVLSIDMKTGESETGGQSLGAETVSVSDESAEEEKLVSFKVGCDEYAFDINKVSEIIKIREITAVPNVPSYVKGLFTIRNHLLPIIDLRQLLGLPDLISERYEVIDRALDNETEWFENLAHTLEAGTHFTRGLNAKESNFGIWLENYKTASVEIETIIKRLKKSRLRLYNTAAESLELRKKARDEAAAFLNEKCRPLLKIVTDIMTEFKKSLSRHILEDQRAMVVEADSMTVGYLVDWVDEVLRIPKSVIDKTPAVASSERKEVSAVAKLDSGQRLIMIMDESALISHETSRIISDQIRKKEKGSEERSKSMEGRSLAEQSLDEEQLVTFTVNREEYGIRIMQVQEINRLSAITAVPRAPYFVDGMTNLRGNIIPVINIRKLFALEDRKVDDRTRIIIVDIGGSKTGLRVDQVNEVLRLEKQDIVKTPNVVVSGGANKYMEGVCKFKDGKRMVMLLNVEKILDEEELRALSEIVEGQPQKAETVSVRQEYEEEDKAEEEKTETPQEPEKKKLEIAE